MKRTMLKAVLFGLAMVMAVAPLAMATTIKIGRVPGYYSGSGGEFWIQGLPEYQKLYDAKAIATDGRGLYTDGVTYSGKGFETFCLEEGETIAIPSTQVISSIQQKAMLGGMPNGDPISLGTGLLYGQFARGVLAGYNYTAGVGRVSSAAALQEAIWYLEDEITLTSAQISANSFLQLVKGKFGSLAIAHNDNNGLFAVAALNFEVDGHKQSQTILTPEPGSLLLFGIGLLGAAGLRRKFGKN